MKFYIEIAETLSRVIEIETETPDEAVEQVEKLYRNSEVILDSSDYKSTDFKIVGRLKQ